MNIFTGFFLQNFSKIFSKTHQIAPFLKIFSGEHTPEPPYQTRGFAIIPPLFQKYFEPRPPPPRNEILDTPLENLLKCILWVDDWVVDWLARHLKSESVIFNNWHEISGYFLCIYNQIPPVLHKVKRRSNMPHKRTQIKY